MIYGHGHFSWKIVVPLETGLTVLASDFLSYFSFLCHILYSMLVSRVLYLANLTNSRKIAKLNPRESY